MKLDGPSSRRLTEKERSFPKRMAKLDLFIKSFYFTPIAICFELDYIIEINSMLIQ